VLPELADADAATIRLCLRDVLALSTLAAVWAGAKPLRIAESLASALYAMLGADFVYVSPFVAARDEDVSPFEAMPGCRRTRCGARG
jgi:hypothetical protein